MNWFRLLCLLVVLCTLLSAANAGKGKSRNRKKKCKQYVNPCTQNLGENVVRTSCGYAGCPDEGIELNVTVRTTRNATDFLNTAITYGLRTLNMSLYDLTAKLEMNECRYPKSCTNELNPTKKSSKKEIGRQNHKRYRVLAQAAWLTTSIEASLSVFNHSKVSGLKKDIQKELQDVIQDARRARGHLQVLGEELEMCPTPSMTCQTRDVSPLLNDSKSSIQDTAYVTVRDARDAAERILENLEQWYASGLKHASRSSVFNTRKRKNGKCIRKSRKNECRRRRRGGRKGKKDRAGKKNRGQNKMERRRGRRNRNKQRGSKRT